MNGAPMAGERVQIFKVWAAAPRLGTFAEWFGGYELVQINATDVLVRDITSGHITRYPRDAVRKEEVTRPA